MKDHLKQFDSSSATFILLATAVLFSIVNTQAQSFITGKKEAGAFPIVSNNSAATIYTDEQDHWLVQKAASFLQSDIEMVSGIKAPLTSAPPSGNNIIIIGSLDRSAPIKRLV